MVTLSSLQIHKFGLQQCTFTVSHILCGFAASESPVLAALSWEVRRQLATSGGDFLVGFGKTAESRDERRLRRAMTDTTSLFSECNVVVEGDWTSESLFESESEFEATSPSPPPVVCDEATTEQRANEALKGFSLTFRDPYLEADYQSARERELRRSMLAFRSTLGVLLGLWIVFNLVTLTVQRGINTSRDRWDLVLSFVPFIPLAVVLIWSFRRSFASRFEGLVGFSAVAYIVLQNIVDYRLVS